MSLLILAMCLVFGFFLLPFILAFGFMMLIWLVPIIVIVTLVLGSGN